jgi:hypothetical protein
MGSAARGNPASRIIGMKCSSHSVRRDLPAIERIIDEEVWLEAERRGCAVPRHDPVVRERVCRLLLGNRARCHVVVADGAWVFTELIPEEASTADPRIDLVHQDLTAA